MTRETMDTVRSGEGIHKLETLITADDTRSWINFSDLWAYRDLLYFLVWRDLKAKYAQSVLGIGWAVIQPVIRMVVFTLIFGKLARLSSDGAPYAVFSYVALVPWTYFSAALSGAGGSVVGASGMLTKVYFPRLIIPLGSVLSKLIDFAIAFAIIFVLLLWYGIVPNLGLLALPLLLVIMIASSAGIGMWLTSLAVKYRDVNYAMGFFVQILMYLSPVVYSTSIIPPGYRLLYGLNPMVGVIEGFRSAFLGTIPMPWDLIGLGALTSSVLLFSGILYFRRMEKYFADVI